MLCLGEARTHVRGHSRVRRPLGCPGAPRGELWLNLLKSYLIDHTLSKSAIESIVGCQTYDNESI